MPAGLTLLLLLAAPSTPAKPLTTDEVLARHVAARGGLDRLRAVRSERATGKVEMGDSDAVTVMGYVEILARPGRLRIERTIQGLTAITAFDGETGWRVSPFRGRREPDRLPPDVIKSLAVDADLDGPLVDPASKGHKVEYVGTEDVDGTAALKLKVTLKSGDVQVHYLDPDHYLTIRVLSREVRRGAEEETETDYGEYEQVDGVWLPFSIESGGKGMPKGFKVRLDRVELNLPVDEAVFRFPAPAGEEPKR